jgi:phosphopantothenate-cysteine ligase
MHQILLKYGEAKKTNRILMLDFVTLPEYLFKLQAGTQILARLQSRAMYYLAAAVSDFFIPSKKMVEHKIQSRGGGLTLELDQVPKFLKPLVSSWAAKGLIVSFKVIHIYKWEFLCDLYQQTVSFF